MDSFLGIDDIIDLFNQYGFYNLTVATYAAGNDFDAVETNEIDGWKLRMWRTWQPISTWHLIIYKNNKIFSITDRCIQSLDWFTMTRPLLSDDKFR